MQRKEAEKEEGKGNEGAHCFFKAFWPGITAARSGFNALDELAVNWTIGLSSWPDMQAVVLRPENIHAVWVDIWLPVCMLTVALFVISRDLDPILDYGQVRSHYDDL